MSSKSSLPSGSTERIDQLCDAFEQSWRDGRRPRIEDFLGRVEDTIREQLWMELLLSELECRKRRGEDPTLDEYLCRFPDQRQFLHLHFNEYATIMPSASAPSAATPDGQQISGYELLEAIARGGMGVVYKARQVSLNRIVAVKMILGGAHADDEQRSRFRIEAEAAARLQHPNVVQVHEVGEQAGLLFLVMEYVDGPSLRQWLAERHAQGNVGLTPHDAAGLIETLAGAVEHAHRHGIIHRDLKPANVLLAAPTPPGPLCHQGERGRKEANPQAVGARTNVGEDEAHTQGDRASAACGFASSFPLGGEGGWLVKIADFGLAKRLDAEQATTTGRLLGTPSYLPPEQARGKVVGPQADVYSLGAILYECLTGRPPFVGETIMEILEQTTRQEVVPPSRLRPRVPRDLETICLKCLRKEPEKRYSTAAELADDLHRFRAGEPIRARRTSVFERVVKWGKRRPVVVALTAVVVVISLLTLAGGVWYLRERSAQRLAAAERRDSTTRQVQTLRLRAADLSGSEPTRALGLVRQAEGLLENAEGLDDLREQVRSTIEELEGEERGRRLLAKVENVRLSQAGRTSQVKAAELDDALTRAFGAEGVAIDGLSPAQVVALFRPSQRRALAAAMVWWAAVRQNRQGEKAAWQHLLAIAHEADPNPVRRKVREAVLRGDRKAMIELADPDVAATLSAEALVQLGEYLGYYREHERAVALLRQAQHQHSGEFWINHYLAVELGQLTPPRPHEALRFFTVAQALRPRSAGAALNLGNALAATGQPREAVAAFRKATQLDPTYAAAFSNLGQAHLMLGENASAIDALTQAVTLAPSHANSWYYLGWVYVQEERFAEAVAAYGKVAALRPNDAETHYRLGGALLQAGRFSEALRHSQRSHELSAKDPEWRDPAARQAEEARLFTRLEAALSEVLKGSKTLDDAEWLSYAALCYHKRRYDDAIRCYVSAFAAEGERGAREKATHRFDAACAAAKAGSVQQGLAWLRESLTFWRTQLRGDPKARSEAQRTLQFWRRKKALAGLRDAEAMAERTAQERANVQAFWAEIDKLLASSTEKQ